MIIQTPHGVYDETCARCTLHSCRQPDTIPVYGQGNPNADFLVLAEAPSIEDQCTGSLFTGTRGTLLYELLQASGIDPKQTYRTTVVACPSYIVIPATDDEDERISYQDPSAAHISACLPRLHEIIYNVDPRAILCFGDLPWKALLSAKQRKNKGKIEDVQGELYDVVIPGRRMPLRYPLLALLSLTKIAKNPSVAKHAPLATTVRHLTRVAKLTDKLKENP